jgi:hypothetical protein
LWDWEAHSRAQHTGRRDDAWRRVAAWLTNRFSHIVLDELNLLRIASVPDLGAEDTAQARAARALRTIAAPGALRAAISNAAQRRGRTVTTVPASGKGTVGPLQLPRRKHPRPALREGRCRRVRPLRQQLRPGPQRRHHRARRERSDTNPTPRQRSHRRLLTRTRPAPLTNRRPVGVPAASHR